MTQKSPRFSWNWEGQSALLATAVIVLVWEGLSRAGLISSVFLPSPSSILIYFFQSILNGSLLVALGATLSRLAAGFLLGAIPGVALGLAMGRSRRLRVVVDPFIAALHPLPKISIFPLIMIVFGLGETSKIFAVALSAFFPMLINTLAGVRQTNPVYIEVARNYGASRWKTLRTVILPGSLPMILAGVRIAVNTSLVIVIAVELLAASNGLGVMIWFAWETLRVLPLYAALLAIALVGLGINLLLQWLSAKLAPWHFHAEMEEGF